MTKACECAACGKHFGGVSAFDLHRAGPHDGARRCLDEWEMVKAGLSIGKRGRWSLARIGFVKTHNPVVQWT